MQFQSTLPRGERQQPSGGDDGQQRFQSTLPRGERPLGGFRKNIPFIISIHAPARGATGPDSKRQRQSDDFNPRSREGSDAFYRFLHGYNPYFNPRSREGSDAYGMDRTEEVRRFQSTLPRGERPHSIR